MCPSGNLRGVAAQGIRRRGGFGSRAIHGRRLIEIPSNLLHRHTARPNRLARRRWSMRIWR